MPKKTKDEEVKKVTRKRTTKKDTIEVEDTSTSIKKATQKASTAKKKTATKKSPSSKPKASSTKNTTAKKSTKVAPKKSTTAKKSTTKRTTRKKVTPPLMEYYDLPAVYNRTIIKILAQTPSSLFVYWEISEDDRLRLQNEYGESFFQNTKPYLVITNETMNYSFEVEINDYANSWYIHISDSDCKYAITLIRKSINDSISLPNSYINITSSNKISTPNDHILFDKLGKTVFFRNIKSNIVSQKDISSFSFISNMGKIYNIYDLYKEIYKNELNGDELGIGLSSSRI